tara:strand:+ start:157 stop:390 length:234 start_codon:yes stop_codon:yes gene_type:complete
MAIKSRDEMPPRCLEIDLTGPEGNAFVLLAYADRFARQLGYDTDRRERILMEMKLADYECLLQTFDREFGSFVTMWR